MLPDLSDTHITNNPITIVKGACPHDCPDTCAIETHVQKGIAIKVVGAAAHPTTQGVLCTKVARYTERTYHAERLLYPQKRVGKKGEGQFVRVSWEQAIAEIGAHVQKIALRNPQAILPYSYAGTMGLVQSESMAARFFNKLGAAQLERTICSAAGFAGVSYTLGAAVGMDMEAYVDSKLIIIWGGNPIASNLHFWSSAQEAKRKGAKLICIDPYRSLTAEKCHQHIALQPGTDGALALALMHELIANDWLDHDYITRYTLGFAELKTRVAEWSAARVAKICGISVAEIKQLAHDYAHTQPAAIRMNYGLQRTAGGGMAARNIACLPALIGAWRTAAGGVLLSSSGHFSVNTAGLQRPDLYTGAQPARVVNMSTIGDALCANDAQKIEALIVYNSNPVAIAPDSARVAQGFAREDLFTVVLEHFQTDTADYADFLLPATTQLEHVDVHKTYGHRYMVANNPAIAPLGEAKPNTEIFRLLAQHMGYTEPCFQDSDEAMASIAFADATQAWHDVENGNDAQKPRARGFSWLQLKIDGWQKCAVPDALFAQGHFPTPSGKCEFLCARMAQIGLDALPHYIAPRESPSTNPQLAAQFPLQMLSPPARNFLNSTFVNVQSLRDTEGEPHLEIHPHDAAARGITHHATVRVFNQRGSLLLRARVTEKAKIGVVVALSIWWKKMARDGKNVNELTSQALTDMGNGPTFYDTLVQVECA